MATGLDLGRAPGRHPNRLDAPDRRAHGVRPPPATLLRLARLRGRGDLRGRGPGTARPWEGGPARPGRRPGGTPPNLRPGNAVPADGAVGPGQPRALGVGGDGGAVLSHPPHELAEG